MTGLSIRNPIAVLMLCVGVVVFAGVVTPRMAVDTFPELTPPVLVIGTLAPGLAARDVEKTLSWRLEKYVSATPGVDHVESLSRNNFSVIYVWLKWGTDLNAAQTLVQSQAGFAMAAVPKSLGVLPPFVLQYDPSNAPVGQVVVSGAGFTGPQLYDYAFNNIEPLLEGIPGVASAAPDGGRLRQINVVVDPVKAQARQVTSQEIAAAVSRANALLPSGEFLAAGFDANVYTNAIPRRVRTIGEAPIKVVGDKPVLIHDVARVEDSGTPQTQIVSVNGRDAVLLNVLRVPGGNTIEIVDAVKKVVEGLSDLPPGMQAKVYFDQSVFVRTAYHGLKKEIVQALVLIAAVILLFLQSVRGTLIVSVAIPLSFAITLLVLYATGQTLNAFTLGGLTLAMGRLVDDAIVVLESIHRHQRMGMTTAEAALAGTNAVALPVLASTLTTMAVLLPVMLLAGLARKLFAPLAITVAVAMIASYLVSMAVTPVACRFFLGHAEPGRLAQSVEAFIDRVAERYSRALRRVLPFRATILVAAAVLVAASGGAAGRLPSTFFPEIDESMDMMYVRFAPGISVADAARKMTEMGRALTRELPEGTVEMVVANVGMPQNARSLLVSPNVAPNTGYLRVAFSDPEKRTLSQAQIAARARAILTREFPGVEVLQYPGGLVASVFANGYTAPFVVEVHDDNMVLLDEEARAVAEVARTVPGIRDVKESLQIDYPEIHVDTNRAEAGLVGASVRDAAQTTLDATLGNINTPGVWIDANNGQSYYVVTFYDGAQVPDIRALGSLPLRVSPAGNPVLLGAYGDVRRELGAVAVERNHLSRVAHVLMQTEGRDLGSAARDLEEALRADPRTRHVDFRFVGQVQLMRTTFSGLGLALGLAVMVVFMIMASQFKSLRLPFVMLFTIPVSLVGVVLALLAAGQGFSITALMGILMVIGIAVSNGILLVDDANRRFADEGADKVEAIVAAARSRFVPIAMTSLATVIGLIPTAMGLERGSEANQPLALAVVGGLTSSTVLSLFLVPVMFLLLAKRRDADATAPSSPWPAERRCARLSGRKDDGGGARYDAGMAPSSARPPTGSPRVLVVDDDASMAEMLAEALADRGFAALTATSATEAARRLGQERVDAIVTDLQMPDVDGLELLSIARRTAPGAPVIVMTAYSAVDSAIESIRRGAYHYLTKPFKVDELALFLTRALDDMRLRREAASLRRTLKQELGVEQLVGRGEAMHHVRDLVLRVADADAPVLVLGETGTGKGLVARAIHAEGKRSSRPFVTVSCAALPDNLLESELFGHVKGAFTGAIARRVGLFEAAQGGTVFLDEVGELSLALQAKLLDVLERGVIRAVGSNKEVALDVRVLAATHRPLRERVAAGAFREDLFYRLEVLAIDIPPLRRRRDDIPALLDHFLAQSRARHPPAVVERIGPEAMAVLLDHRWPGNVRELQHVVERLVLLGRSPEIAVPDLPASVSSGGEAGTLAFGDEVRPLREIQRRYVAWAFDRLGGRKLQTAERLQVDIKTLGRWLQGDDGDR